MAHRKCNSPWCGECNFTWDKPEVAAKMRTEDAAKVNCPECHTLHLPGRHTEVISDEMFRAIQKASY